MTDDQNEFSALTRATELVHALNPFDQTTFDEAWKSLCQAEADGAPLMQVGIVGGLLVNALRMGLRQELYRAAAGVETEAEQAILGASVRSFARLLTAVSAQEHLWTLKLAKDLGAEGDGPKLPAVIGKA